LQQIGDSAHAADLALTARNFEDAAEHINWIIGAVQEVEPDLDRLACRHSVGR
jgi:hypothetical protein